jgi:hypothetical protein
MLAGGDMHPCMPLWEPAMHCLSPTETFGNQHAFDTVSTWQRAAALP